MERNITRLINEDVINEGVLEDSPIINSKELALVRNNILGMPKTYQEWLAQWVEYINYKTHGDNNLFFYDMLEFIRFLDNDNNIAYTTPDHLIFLAAPGQVGKNIPGWEFIYYHECLHQLWDTFGVADEIRSKGIEYDHDLLNIASDCVINEFIKFKFKLQMPIDGIDIAFIRSKYNIEFDIKKDTQFSLYMKLLPISQQLKKDLRKQLSQMDRDDQAGEKSRQDGQQGQGGQSGQGNQSSQGGQQGQDGQQTSTGKGQGDQQGQDGQQGQDSQQGQGGQSGQGNQQGRDDQQASDGKGQGGGQGSGKPDESTPLSEIKRAAEAIIKKYAKSISGAVGEFVSLCKESKKCQTNLSAKGHNEKKLWSEDLQAEVKNYVRQQVQLKKRELQTTYSRVKRGSGLVDTSKRQLILPGTKIKQDSISINLAFYIDNSGSMFNCLDTVSGVVYDLAKDMERRFRSEKMVDEVTSDIYTFNTEIHKVSLNSRLRATGGTLNLDDLLSEIESKSLNYMINVIITDGNFEVHESKVLNFLKQLSGMFILISNNISNFDSFKLVANKSKNFKFIEADSDFSIK